MKIKIKYQDENVNRLAINPKGEWIDLSTACNVIIEGPKKEPKKNDITFNRCLINLGIAMKLPKYFEAIIAPRSGTYNKYDIIMANSIGIIDSSFCGNYDIWRFNAIALRDTKILPDTRIAQFRIQPSQFAPWWVKLKWLFTNKIEFVEVNDLKSKDRGGFGSTGI